MQFFAYLKKLNKLGASMVEYAIVLACIASIGVTVTSPNLTNTLDSLFSNVTKILALNDEASKPASKYNIGDDAKQYEDALTAVLDYLGSAPLLDTDGTLAWVLFNVHGKLDNFSNYINTTNLQTATYPNVTNKQKNYFDLGLSQALEATNYKINGGSVFYDREGNVVYNNPKNNPIGGQGRYTYVELVDKSTNSVSYVYYGSDNTWHYSAIKPSKDGNF